MSDQNSTLISSSDVDTYPVIVDVEFLERIYGDQDISHIGVDLLLLVPLP